MAGSFVLIPAAIEAGLGELGKHGSMIYRQARLKFSPCLCSDKRPAHRRTSAATSAPPTFV